MRRITDHKGDRWPITGRTCAVCRWPLHRALAAEVTHPGCGPPEVTTRPTTFPTTTNTTTRRTTT